MNPTKDLKTDGFMSWEYVIASNRHMYHAPPLSLIGTLHNSENYTLREKSVMWEKIIGTLFLQYTEDSDTQNERACAASSVWTLKQKKTRKPKNKSKKSKK